MLGIPEDQMIHQEKPVMRCSSRTERTEISEIADGPLTGSKAVLLIKSDNPSDKISNKI